MNAGRAASVLGYLRRLSGAGIVRAAGDADLLERFADRRDDAAFAELVRRHGPMVLGVCRRILGNLDDAEDAFQATFLVLAARPRAVGDPSSLANWLYGVARRTALRAQVETARRYCRERLGARPEAIDTTAESVWRDLRPMLDAEVARLPSRCREVFVLCCLEGLTHEEAGRLLGCPGGTVASRLSRARERLRNRLVRRGLTLSAVGSLLAVGEAEGAITSERLAALARAVTARITTTISTAGSISPRVAALTEGVLKAMWMTKLKVAAAVVLAVSAAGFGAGVVLSTAAQPGAGAAAGQPVTPTGDRREVAGPVDTKPATPAGTTSKPPKEEEEAKKARNDALPPPASVEEAKDAVELLEARLDARRAELEAVKAAVERARADLARVERLAASKAISQGEVDAARAASDNALAQVRIKEAEFREPEILLKQARRRLEALRGAPSSEGNNAGPKDSSYRPAEPSSKTDAREAVELMEAQVAIQRARLQEGKVDAEAAKAALDRLALLAVVSESDKARAATEARSKAAQVTVREAELQEAEVRLKHARRRADDAGKGSGSSTDAQRIEELQKTIDRLQKELETLKSKKH